MNMKKTGLLILVMWLFITLFITGCGSDEPAKKDSPSAAAEDATVELKVAHMWPAEHPYTKSIQYFADSVTKETEGKITFKMFPANSLAQVNEMYEAVTDGVADLGFSTSSFLAPRMPEMSIFEIPGAYDPAKFMEIKDSIRPTLEEVYDKYGLVYLFALDSSDAVLASKKPISDVGDLKNMKIRDYGPTVGKSLKQLGATPMTIPSTDLNIALERGTVDGAYSAWTFVFGYKVYEQAKNIIWPGFQNMWSGIMMDKESWAKLSQKQQEIILKAAKDAEEHNFNLVGNAKKAFIDVSQKAGATHTYFTDAQRNEAFELIKPMFESARKDFGPLAGKLLDKLDETK